MQTLNDLLNKRNEKALAKKLNCTRIDPNLKGTDYFMNDIVKTPGASIKQSGFQPYLKSIKLT